MKDPATKAAPSIRDNRITGSQDLNRMAHRTRGFPSHILIQSCIFMLFLTQAAAQSAEEALPTPQSQNQHDARMSWWRDAHVGMSIHWGLYAVTGGTWHGGTGYGRWLLESTQMPVSQYGELIKQFNPEKFDAKEWVRIAKSAGMKYLIVSAKDYDGFCMFPSTFTDWGINATAFKHDPLAELADACTAAGIHFGISYSILDWHHPDWGNRRAWNDTAKGPADMARYVAFMKNQFKEILTRYHPEILWFDGEWEAPWTHGLACDLEAYLRSLAPDVIISNHIDPGYAGMPVVNPEPGSLGDFSTSDQLIPVKSLDPGVDWESSLTLNDHWGYNKADQRWKSPPFIIYDLVTSACRGGNLLLGIGASADGLLPAPCAERLAAVGDWLSVNGESIYGTSKSPFVQAHSFPATQKNGCLYLHIFTWPENGTVLIPMDGKVTSACLLADATRHLTTSQTAAGVSVVVGATAPDAIDSVLKLTLAGPVLPIFARVSQDANASLSLTADIALLTGPTIRLEGDSAVNIGYWSSLADTATWQAAIDKPGTFSVSLVYALEPEGEGNAITISAGEGTLQGSLHATRSWEDYDTTELGTITISKPGIVLVTVKPARRFKGEGLMNVRLIKLTPSTK